MKFLVALALTLALASAAFAPESAPGRPLGQVTHRENTDEDAAPLESSAAYGPYDEVWRVHTERKDIALTFDDGPYPFYTPLLLHVLDRSKAHATFFVVGRSAQSFPELVMRILADGDEIGNHTFNHIPLTKLSDQQIEDQILEDGSLLRHLGGEPVTLFRPPHGRFNLHVVVIAKDLGYHTIFWSDSPDDVKDISPAVVVRRVVSEASPGGIILLHSGEYHTIEALPVIIDRLRAQGYRFVTVSQLLDETSDQPDR
jgi:peptidoglycan/xylan/chitin deacetylase (PgdA/CDA1 family)